MFSWESEPKQTVYLQIVDTENINTEKFKTLSKAELEEFFFAQYVGKNMRDVNLKLCQEMILRVSNCNTEIYRNLGELEIRLPSKLLMSYNGDALSFRKMTIDFGLGQQQYLTMLGLHSRRSACDDSRVFYWLKEDYHLKEEDIQKLWFSAFGLYKNKRDSYIDKIKFPYSTTHDPLHLDLTGPAKNLRRKLMSVFNPACLFIQGQRQERGEDGSPSLLHDLPNEIGIEILKRVNEELDEKNATRAVEAAYHVLPNPRR